MSEKSNLNRFAKKNHFWIVRYFQPHTNKAQSEQHGLRLCCCFVIFSSREEWVSWNRSDTKLKRENATAIQIGWESTAKLSRVRMGQCRSFEKRNSSMLRLTREQMCIFFSACDRPLAFKCAFVCSNLKKKIAARIRFEPKPVEKNFVWWWRKSKVREIIFWVRISLLSNGVASCFW